MKKFFLVIVFWGLATFMLLAKWPVRQLAEAIGYESHPDAAVWLLAGQYLVIIYLIITGASILSRRRITSEQ